MSERSIPEILGWEPAPDDWGYVDRYFQHPTAGYAVNEHGGWSVDDLLAWIRARGFDFYANASWVTHNPYFVSVAGTEHSLRLVVRVEARGHSLLEALEDAVRAIDAEAT